MIRVLWDELCTRVSAVEMLLKVLLGCVDGCTCTRIGDDVRGGARMEVGSV